MAAEAEVRPVTQLWTTRNNRLLRLKRPRTERPGERKSSGTLIGRGNLSMSSDTSIAYTPRSEGSQAVRVIRPPSVSPADLAGHLRSLTRYAGLIYTLSEHRIQVRYKQSLLGIAWAIVQPVALMAVYTVIFSLVAPVRTNGIPYAIFVFAGLVPWTYFSTAVTAGSGALVSHSNLITKVYFPREILPLTYVIVGFFDFLIASSVLAGLMVFSRVPVNANILYSVPVIAIMTMFVIAMVLILSATQVRFRDVGVGLPLLLQIWMFATPIVYPLSAATGLPWPLGWLYRLNPMVGVIESFRRTVLQGMAPDFALLGVSVTVTAVLLPAAYLYFKRVESTAADVI
jgi:lipopolysaccharide transport system permease protein